MRGLGHVYRAVGDFLAVYGPPKITPAWPDGWEPDPDAFNIGMDLSVPYITADDQRKLESWYETNMGYVSKSIAFGIKYHPEFVKVTLRNGSKKRCRRRP